MDEINEIKEIEIGGKIIKLDPAHMRFDEHTLTEFLQKEAGFYAYYGACLAEAEFLMQRREMEYDIVYSQKFKECKENGATEKLAEAAAKADPEVEKVRLTFLASKYKVRLLQQHLRAWDRAHENAQSRGHFLRKEMDKLNKDIYFSKSDPFLEDKIDDIIRQSDK
jgi:hypothetical protein